MWEGRTVVMDKAVVADLHFARKVDCRTAMPPPILCYFRIELCMLKLSQLEFAISQGIQFFPNLHIALV